MGVAIFGTYVSDPAVGLRTTNMNRKYCTPLATFGALLVAGAANAGFVIMDNGGAPLSVISPIPTNNDFRAELNGLGITQLTLGGSLALSPDTMPGGAIGISVFASEAGFMNQFNLGTASFTSPGNLAWMERAVGSVPGGPGMVPFEFCALTISSCLNNAQNANTAAGSFQSVGMWVSADGNTAWLLWDDSGSDTDDNHDDLIIRLTYRVPEPATLGLLGLGLLGVGAIRRKRTA